MGGWSFPVRFNVKLIHKLEPGTSVPVLKLKDELSIFKNLKNPKAWSGFFRGSPALFTREDGEIIVEAIKEAEKNPEFIEFDEKKLWRKPKTYKTKGKIVTIPKVEKVAEKEIDFGEISLEKTTHEEIQYFLLKFGSDMGLGVYAARGDRNKSYNERMEAPCGRRNPSWNSAANSAVLHDFTSVVCRIVHSRARNDRIAGIWEICPSIPRLAVCCFRFDD